MPAPSFNPKNQLDKYLEAVNAHDIDRTLGLLADAFRLEFVDYGSSMTKPQVRAAMEWDAGTNGRVSYDDLELGERSATAVFTEVNDFLTLVKIESLKSRNTYTFDDRGLILQQRYEMLPDQPSFQQAMQPAVEWAEVNRPDELAEIYPEGRMIYNREMAKRWVKLLREWRDS